MDCRKEREVRSEERDFRYSVSRSRMWRRLERPGLEGGEMGKCSR
jgi:hypothetical protein